VVGEIDLPQNYFAIRSVCERLWQIILTGSSAESQSYQSRVINLGVRLCLFDICAVSLVEGGHKGVPGGGAFSCWSQALPPVA